ncbi:YDG/SRA domain-containing protein [Kineococcus sp. SYSU DK004]|uniref:YDG/SRA domain-containing protein n=1 Tax=Kineococcus sp. SYSU DK004 TaxID=3383125 RepID=UPI003D7CBA64
MRYFGAVDGVAEGALFPDRSSAARARVHLPNMAGISGTKSEGADSIVVNGGYEDDVDFGDEIVYTGAGGNDMNTKKQVADQTFDHPGNGGLVTSQERGLPVRVVRGFKGDPFFSPPKGYRYDGLYRVVEHWSETGLSGFQVCRFRLKKFVENS